MKFKAVLFIYIVGLLMCFGEDKPNFIIIFTDDQGYNDLSCFGSKKIKTPNIDSIAKNGRKFTSFYASV